MHKNNDPQSEKQWNISYVWSNGSSHILNVKAVDQASAFAKFNTFIKAMSEKPTHDKTAYMVSFSFTVAPKRGRPSKAV